VIGLGNLNVLEPKSAYPVLTHLLFQTNSVADPGYGAFFDAWIRELGRKDQDSGPNIRKNIPDHISRSLVTIIWF